MKLTEENLKEKEFHNTLQSKKGGRFENIFYKAIYNLNEDFFEYIEKHCKDKSLLDYGCGIGNAARKVVNFHPKKITGIDISDVSIKKAIDNSKNLDQRIDYMVDNCENSNFKSETFDMVYGSGILHHLNMKKCLEEIHRLLKKDGELVFVEPLGTNPIINLYRKLTPNSRSRDEHPLNNEDFVFLKQKYKDIKINYYGFFTLIFFPFYRNPKDSWFFNFFSTMDKIFFKIKFLRFLAWSVLIVGKKN